MSSLRARAARDLTRPERPDFHLVFVPTEGVGSHAVDFVSHPLRSGVVLTVAAGQVQQFAPASGFDAVLVVLRPEATRWAPEPARPVTVLDPLGADLVGGLLPLLRAASEGRRDDVAARLVESLGAVLAPTAPPLDDAAVLVARFRAEVERHHARAREVAAYAALLHCTTKTLTRHCRATTGQSPKRIIDDRVVLAARRRLAYEAISVGELADALTFPSVAQFVRFFRRLTSETPQAFRVRVRAATGPRIAGAPPRAPGGRASS